MNENERERRVFSPGLEAGIAALKEHYPESHAAVIPSLHLVQESFGYISDEALVRLGELLGVPPAEIYGTMTFYTMFRREKEGLFHINICRNISCHLNGSRSLKEHFRKILGIDPGRTTADGLFTLDEVECLGACTEAPVVEVDGEYHFRVTPKKAEAIIADLRKRAAAAGERDAAAEGRPGEGGPNGPAEGIGPEEETP